MKTTYAMKHQGWITMEAQNLSIRWYCKSVDHDSTRIGLVAFLTPTIKIPGWLFRYGCRKIVPQMVDDVTKTLKKKRREALEKKGGQ